MKKPFTFFQVPCSIFEFGVWVLITKDIDRAVKTVKKTLEATNVSAEDFAVQGKHFYKEGYCPIIWIPRFPVTPREYATLSHLSMQHGSTIRK